MPKSAGNTLPSWRLTLPEWITRRRAEPWLRRLKYPIEMTVLFCALLPAYFLYIVALAFPAPAGLDFESFLLTLDWRPDRLLWVYLASSLTTAVALVLTEPGDRSTPIRRKAFATICTQVVRASGITFLGLALLALLALPLNGRLGPIAVVGLVACYTGLQGVGLVCLWALRRQAWLEGQQVTEWRRRLERQARNDIERLEAERHRLRETTTTLEAEILRLQMAHERRDQQASESHAPEAITSIRRLGRVHLFTPETIRYVAYEDGTARAHTSDGIFSCQGSIKEISEKLAAFGFVKLNQGTVVNLQYVRTIQVGKRRVAILDTGKEVVITKQHWPDVKERLFAVRL